jgi:hypothetical protein
MTQLKLHIVPCFISEAKAYVAQHHRHHPPPQGGIFAVAVCDDDSTIHGVAIVGRPVARHNCDGFTAEVTRVATDGTPNACSALYRACWRAASALGYKRLITYTLDSEPGTSLLASGFTLIGQRGGGSWNCASRPRVDKHPTQLKLLWELNN